MSDQSIEPEARRSPDPLAFAVYHPLELYYPEKNKRKPMAVRLAEEREIKGFQTLLGASGLLTLTAAAALFVTIIESKPGTPQQAVLNPPAIAEVSAMENRAFLEYFLFEGFTHEEKIEASKKIAFYMARPGTPIDVGKDIGRNIIQAIQSTPSEDLRPMDQERLKNRVSNLLAQAHPDFSSSQLQTRAKLLMAIFDTESGLRPGIINAEEDAAGLGQVTPASAKEAIMRFKRQADRSDNPESTIFAKYFKDIPINLKTKEITDEEWAIIKNKLKDPDINILVADELLNLYTELHTYPAMGLLAYGSQPTALALAEFEYAKLVGEVSPDEVDMDFNSPEPATKKYTKLFNLNPIKLMHPAVTAALKSTGNFLRVNWNYPWIITAKALGETPDDFPAVARMVEEAKASQTKA